MELSDEFDIFELLYALSMPFVIVSLLFLAFTKRSYPILSMVVVYCVLSWGLLFGRSSETREFARWTFRSKALKVKVVALPKPNPGELRHIEWYGWGFPGAGDTTVYLIHDPSDLLAPGTKSRLPGKFPGIPCNVYRLRRLESHWYAAAFYTDTSWDKC